VQLVARRHRDDLLFRVAAELEALGVAQAPVAAELAQADASAAVHAVPRM
jgi:hypothetical protein